MGEGRTVSKHRPVGVRMTLFASPHMLEPIVVIRQVAGSHDANGEWVPDTETRTEVTPSPLPPTGGNGSMYSLRVPYAADYREFQLPTSVGPIAPCDGRWTNWGDVIEYKGTLYLVRDVQDWTVSPTGYAASGQYSGPGRTGRRPHAALTALQFRPNR